jgi:hypothetical protein
MKFDIEIKEKIGKMIVAKDAVLPCARCGQQNFSLLNGFVSLPLSKEVSNNVVIGGPSVPCAVIACCNCGHIFFHALGALGLLNTQK